MPRLRLEPISVLWLGIGMIFLWLYFYSFGNSTIFINFDNATNQFFRIAMIIFFMFCTVYTFVGE